MLLENLIQVRCVWEDCIHHLQIYLGYLWVVSLGVMLQLPPPKYDIEVTQVWNAFGFIAFLQEQSEDQRLRSINALRRFPPD